MGIESSCDETAVAVVREDGEILSNLVLSQLKEHSAFGGVVPEIAARAHMDHIDKLVKAALEEADIDLSDLDAVAATVGPGLIGGVMVGMMAGKTIAATQGVPFLGINHLEAHLLTPRLTDKVEFPYLVLLVSGGHTQILVAEGINQYKRWGTTIDDALGECFDKSAKLMGLPYPGGPNLEKMADKCTSPEEAIERFPLPSPLKGQDGCDFSFSGLKTAVRNHVESLPEGDLQHQDIIDLAYSFQNTVGIVLQDRVKHAIQQFKDKYNDLQHSPAFVVCGGVAANKHVRQILENLAVSENMEFKAPPLNLCSDNGAMIAWTGLEKLKLSMVDDLSIAARPRWPLDPDAIAKPGGGVKA
ncbi:MAG: tRNA (adenosine(37)-N6)-threonylcarbamoyltransferase complex transferase subunit TsaD [Pseudomonadota bacterium]